MHHTKPECRSPAFGQVKCFYFNRHKAVKTDHLTDDHTNRKLRSPRVIITRSYDFQKIDRLLSWEADFIASGLRLGTQSDILPYYKNNKKMLVFQRDVRDVSSLLKSAELADDCSSQG